MQGRHGSQAGLGFKTMHRLSFVARLLASGAVPMVAGTAAVAQAQVAPVAPAKGNPQSAQEQQRESGIAVAAAVTPVPGGVGPMTVACLSANTVRAARSLADG